eukprot:CAMPEP_0178424308 /NCGR_PEP_ID=MMETSP0689_2-20121128/28141_1 /TAXON_ID=160604 /ORGANISM="Amphidinium massartii, Strain CS-259" /LENGTH=453 /DNA_ID=CAMNT_0020045937 /DNA_START=39 /DNA_END=1400 /DNA_ORIENTATION=+
MASNAAAQSQAAGHVACLVEKNTFLSLDDSSEEMAFRRVFSEPNAATRHQQRHRLGTEKTDMLFISTEDDVQVMDGPDIAASVASPTALTEELIWPATPEGNFLPLYAKETFAEDCWSKAETTSTVAEVQDGCSSMSTSNADDIHSTGAWSPSCQPLECQWAMDGQATAWNKALQPAQEAVRSSLGSSVPRHDVASRTGVAAASPAPATLTGRLAKAVAIAQLQERLQSSENTTRFKFPPGVKVLQWSYMQKMADRVLFRGVLAFLLNGVPQHVAGEWQPCKKFARQSAADAALAVLRGEPAASQVMDVCVDLSHILPSQRNADSATSHQRDCVRKLETFMRNDILAQLPGRTPQGDSMMAWDCERLGATGGWCASLKVCMQGVTHTFTGPCGPNAEDARTELARRILWHMGHRNFRGLYIVDRTAWHSQQCKVPAAPSYWYSTLGGNRVLDD